MNSWNLFCAYHITDHISTIFHCHCFLKMSSEFCPSQISFRLLFVVPLSLENHNKHFTYSIVLLISGFSTLSMLQVLPVTSWRQLLLQVSVMFVLGLVWLQPAALLNWKLENSGNPYTKDVPTSVTKLLKVTVSSTLSQPLVHKICSQRHLECFDCS